MPLTPTHEQQSIIDSIASRSDSLMISAYAGCSKTTTLELASARVKVPGLALAFNKKIADEMKSRFPGNFAVKTMNGLGHGAWARSLPGVTRLELDDKKLGKLVTQVSRERKVELSSEQWDSLRGLVNQAMQLGLVPKSIGRPGLVEDTTEGWQQAADRLGGLDMDLDFLVDLARDVLVEDIRLARQGKISFDDQVYCSVLLGGQFPKFPVVFVDEAQDLSPLNHAMLNLCSRTDARLVAVGDEKQAIYQFRGADGRSMQSIRLLRNAWHDLPLATTFRCPKIVVARCTEHAPGFTAWHTNAPGEFHQFRFEPDSGEGWTWTEIEAFRAPGDSLAVLCRNNAPLMGLAFKLIRQRVGVVMAGRDLGRGLKSLVKRLAPDSDVPADLVRGLVREWQQQETQLALANGDEAKADSTSDKAECLLAVLEFAEVRCQQELLDALDQLFSRSEGPVTLSSIHRAKGLEWNVVLHLDPWRVPAKSAIRANAAGNSIPLEQEWNLKYVCETRTKRVLVEASLGDFR